MKRTNIVIEVINSGIIPLIIGAFIIFTEVGITDPSFGWALLGLGFIVVGLFLGNDYIEKSSQVNPEKEEE